MLEQLVLLAQIGSTFPLVGLIWTIQCVHYPLFAHIDEVKFAAYHQHHTQRITWMVLPLMLVELASSVALLHWRPAGCTPPEPWLGLGLVACAWIATATLSVPAHNLLASKKNDGAIRRLVSTNWVRTSAWTLRGIWLVSVLHRTLTIGR